MFFIHGREAYANFINKSYVVSYVKTARFLFQESQLPRVACVGFHARMFFNERWQIVIKKESYMSCQLNFNFTFKFEIFVWIPLYTALPKAAPRSTAGRVGCFCVFNTNIKHLQRHLTSCMFSMNTLNWLLCLEC